MKLPDSSIAAIDKALFALEQDPTSNLPAVHRIKMHTLFEELPARERNIALTKLSLLTARKVVSHYDAMNEREGDGYPTMPRLMISVTEALLGHVIAGASEEQIEDLAGKIQVELIFGQETNPEEVSKPTGLQLVQLAQEMDDLTRENPSSRYFLAWCSFLAAKSALDIVMGRVDPANILQNHPQTDYAQLMRTDAAGWAAVAYSGGEWSETDEFEYDEYDEYDHYGPYGVWDYSSKNVQQLRYDFWQWWLRHAIPTSLRLATNT